ncbi:MAG: TIGR02186 family protein [Kiloniellaceae bacterium]
MRRARSVVAGSSRGLMDACTSALVAVCVVLPAIVGPARANTVVADLSKRLVAITTGFAGTEVLLFGATEGPGDVVVVVRGPDRPVVMHRKSRIVGIWINTAQMTFERVPSYYTVASSRPLTEVASKTVRSRHEMGIENLRLDLPSAKASPNVAAEWRAGLIRNHQRLGLFPTEVGTVTFLGNRLFRADVRLPANVPTGAYQVLTYLLQDGRVVSAQRQPLFVSKIGTEAVIYDFAYERSAWYGVIAIVIALVAGWLAHLAFRKM